MTESFIPLSIPHLGGNEWRYVKECLDSGWVSSVGPFVNRFEQTLADYVGAKHAVAVVNGTAALHIALLVVGVKPNDEVLVPNLTFIAPVNAVRYVQAYPVLIDADPNTWQIDVSKVTRFLCEECEKRDAGYFNKKSGRQVKAILPVHLLGLACDMDPLVDLAKNFKLKIVEDAAEAIGVRYKKRHVGTFGDVSAFSFNGNKIVTAGGGGMIVTNNKEYADYARYLTTQAKDDPLEYIHNEIGYNYRLTNIQAALGLAQLEQLDIFLAKKRSIAAYYKEALGKLNGLMLMSVPDYCEATHWLYTVLLDAKTTLAKRKAVIKRLNEEGVGARPFWHTLHDLPVCADVQAYQIEHSVRLYERGICLPSSVHLKPNDLFRVIHVLQEALSSQKN